MVSAGIDLRLVMEVLGHSTITLTADTYAHVAPTALAGARDQLERLLSPRA
jgi:site-specific recombinase XerD